MSYRMSLCLLGLLLGLATVSFALQPEAYEAEKAAPDGTFFCEAEEFQVTGAQTGKPQGWQGSPRSQHEGGELGENMQRVNV